MANCDNWTEIKDDALLKEIVEKAEPVAEVTVFCAMASDTPLVFLHLNNHLLIMDEVGARNVIIELEKTILQVGKMKNGEG